MKCRAADDGRRGHCNSNRPADIAQHVEEPGGISHHFSRNRGSRDGREWDEDKCQGEAREGDWHEQCIRANVEGDLAEEERADTESYEPGREELPVVDTRTEHAY